MRARDHHICCRWNLLTKEQFCCSEMIQAILVLVFQNCRFHISLVAPLQNMLIIISVPVKASQNIESEDRTKELNNKRSVGKKCLGKELFNFFCLVLLIRHRTWGEAFSPSLE